MKNSMTWPIDNPAGTMPCCRQKSSTVLTLTVTFKPQHILYTVDTCLSFQKLQASPV